jgi:nitrile hydratase accessory protein
LNPPEPATPSWPPLPSEAPVTASSDGMPVFAEPWQAQAFAMVLALHQRGLFTWPEWAAALTAVLRTQGATSDGSDYYTHWVKALENLLQAKQAATPAQIDTVAAAWSRAAQATPHGQPVELVNDPLRTVQAG